jgi:hypothetical protein
MSGKRTKILRALAQAAMPRGVPLSRQGWKRLKRAWTSNRRLDVMAYVRALVMEDAGKIWRRMSPEQKLEFLQKTHGAASDKLTEGEKQECLEALT